MFLLNFGSYLLIELIFYYDDSFLISTNINSNFISKKNMKVMITGGLGFIGSHLAEKLCNKHKVIILTKTNSKITNISHINNKLKIEKVDVTNFTKLLKSIKLNKPDVIFHLAGETSHSKSFDNPIHDLDLNAKSTLYLLEIIKKLNLKCRIILGSTFIVVGRPQKLPELKKHHVIQPQFMVPIG